MDHCWECKVVQAVWKTLRQILKKLKIELPYDPEIPLLGIYPKELTAGSQRDICAPMFIAALFTIAKMWKKPKYPLRDEWISKLWYIHTMVYYSALERQEILTHAST